jgi:hypothetical protein
MTETIQGSPTVSTEQVQRALDWVPDAIKISVHASVWLLAVEVFHKQEDEALVNGTYEAARDEHRVALADLIAKGEKIVLAAKRNGIDSEAPFKLKDLEATIESLHAAFHAEHRNSNSEETNREIAKLLD